MANRTTSLVEAKPSLVWVAATFSINETGKSKVSGDARLREFLAMEVEENYRGIRREKCSRNKSQTNTFGNVKLRIGPGLTLARPARTRSPPLSPLF